MNSHRMTDVWYGLNWLDDLDAVSGGWDNLERLYWFSVEDAVGAVEGRPGSAVAFEALNDGLPAVPPGDRAVQGDLFVSVGGSGTNWLWQDEALLGLDNDNPPTPPDDDIDALELTGGPGIYFSVDRTSNLGAADIYASQWDNANMLWAPAPSMGLHAACDNLDALSMFDADGWSWWQTAQILQANPATDWALFSLYPGSASLGLVGPGQFFWWNNWMNGPPVTDAFTGALRSPSPGDILITNFTGQFWLWEDATDIGLNYQDNLDALDVTPEVGTWALLLVTGAFGGWIKRRRKED